MNFRVGQKVVCVNTAGNAHLCVDAIYTVQAFVPNAFQNDMGMGFDGVHLVGVGHPPSNDVPFYATRFRPLVEPTTDISIFTRMLNDKTVEVVR